MGFPGRTYFCSDTWIFKLDPPPPSGQSLNEWAPMASPVEQCDAPDEAPGNLTATGGNGQVALTWDDPNDTTITRYEVRSRLSSATSQGASSPISGSGATTTSYTLPSLTNGTEYTVQVRAVNGNSTNPLGSRISSNGPPSTVSATPKAPPRPPPQPPERPPQPPPMHEGRERVLATWEAWEAEGDGLVVCWLQRYRYERIQFEHWSTTSSWDGSSWVKHWYLNFILGETVRKTAIGNILPISCFGARAQSTSPFLIGGDYVYTWGATSVSFTVPADATLQLDWRALDSGVRAAVLTDAGAGEVLVYPGAAAARDARSSDGTTDKRSADLQSIETSMAEAQSAATTPESSMCAVVSSDGSAAAIDLDAGRCASVPAGGASRSPSAGTCFR